MRPRQLVPNTEDQAIMFSRRSVLSPVEEEIEQNVWNTRINQAPAGVSIELSKWSRNAVTAQDYSSLGFLRSFILEDPVTEFSTLEKNEYQVVSLIGKIRITRLIPDREIIARRLFELLQDVKDEDDSTGISVESLRSFYSFLQTYSYLKKPAIGLTPVNDIYVSWQGESNSIFSINFLPSGFVRFAIITPGPRPEQQARLTGIANVESLMEKVNPWGVLGWASREG